MTGRPVSVPAIPLPDPPLVDREVTLRPWRGADAPSLVQAWLDPEIARWTSVPTRADLAYATKWIDGDVARRARGLALDLVIDVEGAVAGEIGLSDFDPAAGTAEIGWWTAASHRRRGLAARSVRLVASWATAELCIDTATARCDPTNPGSGAVARAAGFAPLDRGDVWVFAADGQRGTMPS